MRSSDRGRSRAVPIFAASVASAILLAGAALTATASPTEPSNADAAKSSNMDTAPVVWSLSGRTSAWLGQGRERVGLWVCEAGGHTLVIPIDATALIVHAVAVRAARARRRRVCRCPCS